MGHKGGREEQAGARNMGAWTSEPANMRAHSSKLQENDNKDTKEHWVPTKQELMKQGPWKEPGQGTRGNHNEKQWKL